MASLKRGRNSSVSIEPCSKVSLNQDELAINPKKIKELSDHLERYKLTGQGTVLILIGPSGSGKTAAIKVLSSHLNLTLTTWSPKDLEDRSQSYNSQLKVYLQSICAVKKALKFAGCFQKPVPSVILIDSPPLFFANLGKEDWTTCLQSVSSYSTKLICIIVSEASKKTIERLFFNVNYHLVQYLIYRFSRPAKMFMFKAIDRLNSVFNCFCSPESVYQASNGNLNKLVNLMVLNKDVYKVKVEGADDYEFQFFHTLGKFLYNKRIDPSGKPKRMSVDELSNKKDRPRLYFDPEDLIDRCQCEQEFFWLYLEENFWEFFSDLHDTQELLSYCQLADQLDKYRDSGFMPRENAVPSYLVARAVMDCNMHPTQIKKLYTMKAPLANTLREKVKMLALDTQLEAGAFGVSRECYLTEMKFFDKKEMMKLCEEEADDDFLWQEINNGVESISVQ